LFHGFKKLYFVMKNLVKKLIQKKLKISFAESCTGGMLASSITSISGASKVFNLGFITYSNQAKINVLKINKNLIKKHGAVSAECCEAMVKNLSKISKAQINVSITGIAGPNGGKKSKPVGLVYIGVKRSNKLLITKNIFKQKTRIGIQKATVKRTLEIINSLI
jgi:nicotinamide-nucleotide amidase